MARSIYEQYKQAQLGSFVPSSRYELNRAATSPSWLVEFELFSSPNNDRESSCSYLRDVLGNAGRLLYEVLGL